MMAEEETLDPKTVGERERAASVAGATQEPGFLCIGPRRLARQCLRRFLRGFRVWASLPLCGIESRQIFRGCCGQCCNFVLDCVDVALRVTRPNSGTRR